MGLENLKSAFSNIILPSENVEKQGTDANLSSETIQKQGTDVNLMLQSSLVGMTSQFSLQTEPQEVDYMHNTNAPGFTANQVEGNASLFTQIDGTNWNSTTGFYNASNVDFPGPVDWLYNTHASGFTLDQVEGNASLFTGIEGVSPNMNWASTTGTYTISNVNYPGPVDWLDNGKASGFTLHQEHKSSTLFTGAGDHSTEPYMEWTNNSLHGAIDIVDGQKIDSSWTTPLTDLTFPDGFTKNMTESELAKGFIGVDAANYTNTNLYSAMGWQGTNVSFNGPNAGGIDSYSPSTSNLIPGGGTTWNSGSTLTSYYDSIHTGNAISDTIFGPVDFMSGVNSYYPGINSLTTGTGGDAVTTFPGIPGFTNNFNTGGYTFSEGQLGNSNFIQTSAGTPPIPTGTHTDYHNPGTSFTSSFSALSNLIPSGSGNWNIPDGFTYSGNTIHSQHPNPTTSHNFSPTGSHGTTYMVDFMSGKSLHELSLVGSASISGFTGYSLPYNLGSDAGNSELLNMWYSLEGPKQMMTSLWTGYYGAHTAWEGGETYSSTINFGTGFNGFLQNQTQMSTGSLTSLTSSYYDSIHSKNVISDVYKGSVDFITGKSLHEASLANSASISGFTQYSMPYNKGTDNGNSELLNLWNTEWGPNGLLTSMWTGYDEDYNTLDFPGPYGNFVPNLTPLSGSLYDGMPTSSLGREWTPSTSYYDSVHPVNYVDLGSTFDINSGFTFASSITASSGVVLEASKGSNKGGQQSLQFNALYGNDHTATDNKYLGPVQDGSDINQKERFNLKSELWNNTGRDVGVIGSSILAMSSFGLGNIMGLAYGNGNEPYIIREIGEDDNTNWGSNFFPLGNLMRDASRVSKFLGSAKGGQFIVNQQIMGTFQQYRPYYDPGSTIINSALPTEGLAMLGMHYPRDFGIVGSLIDLVNTANTYTEWLNTRVTGFDTTALKDMTLTDKTFAERESARKPLAFQGADFLNDLAGKMVDSLIPGGGGISPIDPAGIDKYSGVDALTNMQISMDSRKSPLGGIGLGDPFTLTPISAFTEDDTISLEQTDGMPFYFRDLRDGSVIFFRAYIEGLSENISPSWNSENYIGRSEPVYTYTNAEREIAFTLKLFAQTKDELGQIYNKLNRLTSLCYPEYKKFEDPQVVETDGGETINSIESRVMMKPPMTKFRLGELYGSPTDDPTGKSIPSSAEMVGFIKSLSYEFPDESPWEIQKGYRVPKYVVASITYQVIHSEVPSLEFAIQNTTKPKQQKSFFGINKNLFEEMSSDGTINRKSTTGV